MSQETEVRDQRDALELESGLEALRQSPDFRGPVESVDEHEHTNAHFALIYETRKEQFATAIPFVRHGLERGERCLYIADENSEAEILEAMRARDIDVDAALESGALTIHTKRDTYRRGGTFDPDDMIGFLDDAIDEASEEYEALRVAGEMSWILGDEPDTEDLIEYEGNFNRLLPDEDSLALCQYNRERFPAETIRDIIKTHPHLIYDNTVSQNFYYTPPEEFLGPEDAEREVDRMMKTLRDRTEAKAELVDRQEYLREQNEITATPDRSFEEKLQALFDLGCERFGLELGAMARVDPETDEFEVEYTSAEHEHFTPGMELPLSETYCTAVTGRQGPASVSNPIEGGYEDITVHREFGLKAYLGTYVEVEGGRDRTFFFVTDESRDEPFSEAERTFHNLLGQWVKYELERRRREADVQESKEQFKQIFDSSQDAILIFDPEADEFLDANPAASEMTGYSRDELLSLAPSDMHPHEMDRFRSFADRVADDGAAWTDELACRTKDGDRIPTEVSASQIEHGDRSAVLAVVRDISDRIERKHELEQVERQFEATFNNPVSFVGLLDPDGTIRRVNENAIEFVGVEESDVRGEKFWEAPWFEHSEELRAEIRAGIDRAADGEYVHAELPHRSPDGDTVVMDSMLEPVHGGDGKVIGIVPSGHDITELKERERFQRELYDITADPDRTFDEKLQAVFDLGCERFDLEHGGLARIDPENDRFEVETISGEHEHIVPNEPCPLSETYCQLTSESGTTAVVTDPVESGYEGKLCYEEFGVETYLGTYLELEDDLDRTFFFVSDEPREEFSEAEQTFHHLMGEWVRKEIERKQHQTQLQHKNDRLESFASLLAHELRNPVTIGQIYSRQLPDETDAEAVEYVTEAFDRIEDMIDVMLVLTRGREAVGECTSIELAEVAREAWEGVDAPDATLDVETDRTIEADETYVRHLFRNLLENAVEHGGSDVTVTVGDHSHGFHVADDGTGIGTEDRSAVFEAGYTTTSDEGGTGLGLAFVQKLAAVYEWNCAVTESADGGARFEFENRDPDSQ